MSDWRSINDLQSDEHPRSDLLCIFAESETPRVCFSVNTPDDVEGVDIQSPYQTDVYLDYGRGKEYAFTLWQRDYSEMLYEQWGAEDAFMIQDTIQDVLSDSEEGITARDVMEACTRWLNNYFPHKLDTVLVFRIKGHRYIDDYCGYGF